MKKLIFFVLAVILLPVTSPGKAQTEPPVILVYNNLADSLVMYDSSTSQYTTLIEASDLRRYEYKIALSPTQDYVAAYTLSFEKGAVNRAEYDKFTYTMDIFSLPDGENVLSVNLLPDSYVFRTGAATEVPGDQTYELLHAIGEMAWSPDGSQLAFVVGADGAAANVQIFDAASASATDIELTDSYPARLTWSPDSNKLAYVAVETFLSENGPTGTDVVLVEDGETSLAEIEHDTQYTWLIEWVDDAQFLWSPFNPISGASGLYVYDTGSASSTMIVDPEQPISLAAWDAATETIAFAVPLFDRSEDASPQSGLAPGAYTVTLDAERPDSVYLADNLYGVSFILPGYLAVGNDVIIELETGQEIMLDELRRPDFSPDASLVLGERTSQTILRDLAAGEEELIVNLYYVDGFWLNSERFIAQIGAYGSVIGIGQTDGSFTNLVEDVARDSPFVGFIQQ